MQPELTDKDYEAISDSYDSFIKPVLERLFKDKSDLQKYLIYDTIADNIWIDFDINDPHWNTNNKEKA
jgi:hypothetical protein